jgi:CHAT domain-containing protein
VRQAALAWCQRLAERPDAPATVELAATLLGSGGLGISAGDAACAIARGVREAAEIVRRATTRAANRPSASATARPRPAPGPAAAATRRWRGRDARDRGRAARRRLPRLAGADPADADRALPRARLRRLACVAASRPPRCRAGSTIAPTVEAGVGPLRRQIDSSYRGADYDLIIADVPDADAGSIRFRIDTRRARTELSVVATQRQLVRQLVSRAARDQEEDRRIGGTLFQLLVPQDMEAFLAGTERMVLELDEQAAEIPWELLQSPVDGRRVMPQQPWAIRTRLLRKLRKTHFRARPQDAGADDQVLVIGEPRLRDPRYARLPGAIAEARAVAAALAGPQGIDPAQVALIVEAEAPAILNALFSQRWRIVHIAGHGEPGREGGLVMSDETFLGPREIAQMRTVPELVFVNCCHLAARDAPAPAGGRPPADFPAFAASVADALIEAGVRCVIAAGWAVDDADAETFARTLYGALLAGRPFIDAVAQAREVAWRDGEGSNTWAAYQCYGDPQWVFRRRTGDAQAGHGDPIREEYESLSSPLGLALALEKLAVQARHQGGGARRLDHIRHLEARFGDLWGGMGAVAEAFGLAYAESGQRERAVDWYAQAVAAGDGSASIKAAEQWLNLRVRLAVDRAEKAPAGGPARRRVVDDALAEIADARARLEGMAALETLERLMLCGSACKHLALVAALKPDEALARAARQASADWYERAERHAVERSLPDLFYPAQNRMATALACHDPGDDWPGFDPEVVARARTSVRQKMQRDPDFWCMVAAIEIDAFEAVAEGRLVVALPDLERRTLDLKARMPAPKSWDSTARTARYALAGWSRAAARADERRAVADWIALLERYAGVVTQGG